MVRTWGKIRGKNVVDIFDITSKWPKPLSKATESSSCHCLVLYSFSQSVNGYGKLSINSRKSLDGIIKISPLIEKQYISNGKFSVMQMISSGNVHGLAERLTKDTEGRIKELTGIDIQCSPKSSLKNLSIYTVIENHGLFK